MPVSCCPPHSLPRPGDGRGGADTAGTVSANAARYLPERGHLSTLIDAAIKGERPWLLPPPQTPPVPPLHPAGV